MPSPSKTKRWGRADLLAAALACLCLLAACAAPRPTASGFLSDYGRLRPDPTQMGLSWWEEPGAPWPSYKKLLIEPVQVRLTDQAEGGEVGAAERTRLAKALRQAVLKALAGRHQVVERPGSGVLRVRAALTRLKPVSPALNVVSTAVMMWPMDVGEAALEAQFLDSRSNRVLGELVIVNQGSTLDLGRVWTRWAQVEAAFAEWARLFVQALEEPPAGR